MAREARSQHLVCIPWRMPSSRILFPTSTRAGRDLTLASKFRNCLLTTVSKKNREGKWRTAFDRSAI